MTFMSKLTGLLLIIVFLAGCDSGEKTKENKQLFLLDDPNGIGLLVEDVIEQSGIKKKGFVVIIPVQSESAVKQAERIKQEFYKQGIMAVHILDVDPKASLQRTDILTIENARIICLLDWKVPINEQGQFEESLSKAVKKGSCFVVNNEETERLLLQLQSSHK